MADQELSRTLDAARWTDKAVKAAIDAARSVDPEELGLFELARAVDARARGGKAKEAKKLAERALEAFGEDIDDEDTDGAYHRGQMRGWARWLLASWAREGTEDEPSIPLDARADDEGALDDLEERLTDALPSDDARALADGLWAATRAIRALAAAGNGRAVMRAGRVTLRALESASSSLSDEAESALEPLQREVRAAVLEAWEASPKDDPEWRPLRDYLLSPRAGALRVSDYDLGRMSLDTRRSLVDELAQKHARTQTNTAYGFGMLLFGKGIIPEDEYLSLARELGATHVLVEALLDAARTTDAIDAARAAALSADRESDHEILALAKLLDERGATDDAIELMKAIVDKSMATECDEWLVDRLVALGRDDEADEVLEARFEKRAGLATYAALRERTPKKKWAKLRQRLVDRLFERRLQRVLIDIALDEDDMGLLRRCAEGLSEDQQEYCAARLAAYEGDVPDDLRAMIEAVEKKEAPVVFRSSGAPPPPRVRHSKFGVGEVVGFTGEGAARKLDIEFPEHGRKTILERFVKPED